VPARGALKGIDYSSPLVKYRGERVSRLARIISSGAVEADYVTSADIFYTLYLPAPLVNEESEDVVSRRLVYSILLSSRGAALRGRTVLDALASTIAASVLLAELSKKLDASSTTSRALGSPRLDEEEIEEALSEALRQVDLVKKVRFLAEGLQPGTVSVSSFEDYGLELLKLAREADIQEILRILEGVKHWDLRASKKYARSKRGEKHGYVLGTDIERLAPRSLAYPDELFYARLASGKLVLYEKGVQISSGPVYVLVDKSGSMEGEKMLWAKAVALALYVKCIRSGRDFYLRFFDSQPHPLVKVSTPAKSSDVVRAFDYIARVKSAGGTDITRALVRAFLDLEESGSEEASVVLITDGIDRVSERPVVELSKKTKSRLVTVMVKGSNQSLKKVSAKYMAVTRLTSSGVLKVVSLVD